VAEIDFEGLLERAEHNIVRLLAHNISCSNMRKMTISSSICYIDEENCGGPLKHFGGRLAPVAYTTDLDIHS